MAVSLSKSKYISGLQCPKLLWRLVHDPDSIPLHSAGIQAIFDQGHNVGHLAQSLFPGGVSIPWEAPPKEKLQLTREALPTGKPVYEATFSAGGAYAQVDILVPQGERWDIVEVKSSTSASDIHLHDLSLQRHACEAAGLPVGRCMIAHLNNQYVRQGPLELHKLFALEDLTDKVAPLLPDVVGRLEKMKQDLASETVPVVAIGPHCTNPYTCILKEECWAFLPEHSVFDLYRGGKQAWGLFDEQILSLGEVGSRITLSRQQQVQLAAVQTGQPQIDKAYIQHFLQGLTYPLWLLDFETFQTAVPLYDGTRPYQQIPFQFSLHVINTPGEQPVALAWLAEGKEDPRPGFLAALRSTLGSEGSIIAYNAGFERGRLAELARQFPEHSDWLESINGRWVDLLTPFRDFAYYHPDQHGSCSLKDVLPALTGKSYEGLEIAEGSAAAREFLRAEHGGSSEEERQRIRTNLQAYCGQDTLGMVLILKALREVPV